jgi:Domain of unknown function (DUF4167)
MEPDVHLRWGFARELGFPPGGFWLYRRVAPPGETVVTPPRELGAPARLQWGPATRTFGLHFTEQGLRFDLDDTLLPADIAGRPGNPTVSPPCLHFATAHGGPRFRVTITFPLPVHLDAIESGEIVGPVEFPNVGAPAWLGDAAPIAFASSVVQPSGLFLQSAARLDHPITQLAVDVNPRGTYVHSIAFTPVNACAVQPGPAKAAWDQPDPDGWSRWLTPFELPLTQSQWPSRWPGAPDPATTPLAALETADVGEAKRRLNGQRLDPARTPAQEDADLLVLRRALSRLVAGFPSRAQDAVPAAPPGLAAPDAPTFTLSLLDQLFLTSVNPHLARVLGLYHVDRTAVAGQTYDYCIAGCWEGWWGRELPTRYVVPGLAAPDALARGKARYDGLLITSPVPMWRAMTSPVVIAPAVPPGVAGLFQAVIGAGGTLPPALLGIQAPLNASLTVPAGTISFIRPTAALNVQCAGAGGVQAQLADGRVLACHHASAPKVSLSAQRHYERYLALARAEAQAGNVVGAENYYQHAEHYYRLMCSDPTAR